MKEQIKRFDDIFNKINIIDDFRIMLKNKENKVKKIENNPPLNIYITHDLLDLLSPAKNIKDKEETIKIMTRDIDQERTTVISIEKEKSDLVQQVKIFKF